MFTRTNSGISNQHIFYNVDLIIYTEGGSETFTLDEAMNGKGNTYSVDIRFWKSVLAKLDKRIKFKAVGSKTTCLSLCEKIINKEVSNTAVAMDRDIDGFTGNLIDSPYILYSKGYSWENDVFTRELTCDQIESLLFFDTLPNEVLSIVKESYDNFRRIGKQMAKLEIIFRENGINFISDINSERFFDSKKSPFLNKEQIFLILKEKKKKIVKPILSNSYLKNINPYFDNYGKLLQTLSITIIGYICRKFGGSKSLPKDIITASMLDKFAQKIRDQGDNYYDNIIKKLRLQLN